MGTADQPEGAAAHKRVDAPRSRLSQVPARHWPVVEMSGRVERNLVDRRGNAK